MIDERNLTLLVDYYEMTMGNAFFENGVGERTACFDMFFRKVPDDGGYAVMAGLEQLCEYLDGLSFSEDDIEFLRRKGIFGEKFLNYLRDFNFSCDIWAVPEGTPIFPNEPIITVCGPAAQAQFIETMVLLSINHQSLIATKASRIVRAAKGRPVMEFGSRRAQGYDGAVYGARASYIGGCCGTACSISDKNLGVPALGTMAHSFVQLFDSELEAFRAYAKVFPDACVLLVDTYNVLKSGIPNAVTVFKELEAAGHKPSGIRIDSGDITYLTKKARAMLDRAGFPDVKICVSNSLDEYIISDLLVQGAVIDSFGVGERLVTSRSEPVFGGVYKLSAVEENGVLVPRIKISENAAKVTIPAFKELWRLYDNTTGMAIADVITLFDEVIDDTKPYVIFDPVNTYKRKTLTDFTAKKIRTQIFKNGKRLAPVYTIGEIKDFCAKQLDTIWDEVKRFEYPHEYYVDLSQPLYDIRMSLLNNISNG